MSDTSRPADAPQFPQSEKEGLKAALEAGGWDAAVEYSRRFESPRQRAQLLSLATRIASGALRGSHTLDQLVGFNDKAMEAALGWMAEYGADEGEAEWFKGLANVMAFNAAADLAPCWPEDDEPRERRHYEKGVELGRRMVRWRIELNKRAENFTLAYWALGIHQLGLGEFSAAAESFDKALEHARVAAEEYGRVAAVRHDGDWQVILNHGYRGLARERAGQAGGHAEFESAIAAFAAQAEEHPDLAADARFGSAQLEKTARVIAPPDDGPAPPLLSQQL